MAKTNKFLKLDNKLRELSNKSKELTRIDLFDWVSLIILLPLGLGFIYLAWLGNVVDLGVATTGWILWLTAFFIFRYTKETHHLKKVAQKQLAIEQEPYVIALNGINIEGINGPERDKPQDYLWLRVKNIGRGPAIRVTVSGSVKDKDKALFEDRKQPHSCDLGSGDEKFDWKIDEHQLKLLVEKTHNLDIIKINNTHPIYLYIYFTDQLGKPYKVAVKLFKSGSGNFLKVMENKKLQI